jgi:hypothetical protein
MTIENKKGLMLEKLKEMGFTSIEEALNFTRESTNKIKEDYEPEWTTEEPQGKETKKSETNVAFLAGQTAAETKVYVFDDSKELDIELTGVTKASLSYDPELELPVLHLEIINPFIV